MFKCFWNDEAGIILSTELVLITTILTIGMVVGLVELQKTILAELTDAASAIGIVDQSFYIPGYQITNGNHVLAFSGGAVFIDGVDVCDGTAIEILCNGSSQGEGQ